MTTLKEIVDYQRKFDKKHGWYWETENEFERLENLQFITLGLTSQAGKFADVVKRMVREFRSVKKLPDESMIGMLKKELMDVFIYSLIAAIALNIDLEKEYFERMNANEFRFKKFEQ
jgi:NTP pyrophosphatase (non-canonical NTP hydrolase)